MGKISFIRPALAWAGRVSKSGGATGAWVNYVTVTIPSGQRRIIFGLLLSVDDGCDFRLTITGATKLYGSLSPYNNPTLIMLPEKQLLHAKAGDVVNLDVWLEPYWTRILIYSIIARSESV